MFRKTMRHVEQIVGEGGEGRGGEGGRERDRESDIEGTHTSTRLRAKIYPLICLVNAFQFKVLDSRPVNQSFF